MSNEPKPATDPKEKLAALDKQIEVIKARKAKILAREDSKRRKAETRAKIIIGAWYLSVANRGPDEAKKLLSALEKVEWRDADRKSLEESGVLAELRELVEKGREPKPEQKA